MSYSGGLRWGYAELMRFNGIPLYPGVGPETGFRYRCKLRPYGHSAGRVHMKPIRDLGKGWVGNQWFYTRAQAARAANQ